MKSRASAAVLEGGEHEQLARDELIAALLRELVGDVEDAVQIVGDMHLPGVPSTFGKPIERASSPARSLLMSAPAFISSGRNEPRGAVEQREHHVRRLDDLVVATERERLGIGQRLLGTAW